MRKVEVFLPEERPYIVEFTQEGMPGVMYLNRALAGFESKEVFAWHLSIMIDLEDVDEDGMPSRGEREIIDSYGEVLDSALKVPSEKPNALFLARITWNGTRELIYRVHDPERINEFLQNHIENDNPPRAFDYRIDPDEDWKLTEWHFGTLSVEPRSDQ